jgi:hypothetical protein
MTWTQQVLHVLRRDVSRSAGLLLGVVTFTAIATLIAIEWLPTGRELPIVGSVGYVIPFALGIIWVVVGRDSTVQADAFWALQPLRASAVATAKLLSIAAIVAVALAGSVVTLRMWGYAWASALLAVTWPTIAFASALLGFALIATVATDARGAILALVFSVVGMLVLREMSSASFWSKTYALQLLLTTFAASTMGLFVDRYRRRQPAGAARFAATALGGTLLGLGSVADYPPSPPTVGAFVPVPLAIDLSKGLTCRGDGLVLPIRVSVPWGYQVGLFSPFLTVTLQDGTRVRLEMKDWFQLHSAMGNTLLPRSMSDSSWRVVGDYPAKSSNVSYIQFPPLAGGQVRMCQQIRHLSVEVSTSTERVREVGRVALTAHSRFAERGARMQLLGSELNDQLPSFNVRVSEVRTKLLLHSGEMDPIHYAVVRPATREAIGLLWRGDRDYRESLALIGVKRLSLSGRLEPLASMRSLPGGFHGWQDTGLLIATTVEHTSSSIRRVDAEVPPEITRSPH